MGADQVTRKDRIGINMRLIENPDDLANTRVNRFDGAQTWRTAGYRTLAELQWQGNAAPGRERKPRRRAPTGSQGKGRLSRMNAVLWSYMEAHRGR